MFQKKKKKKKFGWKKKNYDINFKINTKYKLKIKNLYNKQKQNKI